MPVEWNGDEFMQGLREDAAYALNASALMAADFARNQMPQMPTRVTKKGIFFGKKMRGGKTVYTSSPPGGYPGRRTGLLYRSMTVGKADPQSLVASFGVYGGAKEAPHAQVKAAGAKSYGMYLEFGTKNMKARPWAMPTINRAPLAKQFQGALTYAYTKRTGGSA